METHTRVAGEVRIADEVVASIAALAAQEVEGLAGLAGPRGKALRAYVGRKKGEGQVRVDVADGVARADLSIAVRYGYSIPEVSRKVQEKVRAAIETMTGLRVADVNIHVTSVDMEKEKTS